ncbi:hypothetical protein [Pyrolobus fumarii]|uniref:hypothetical protein n=1 Tax=Pyrolobus fumarii TaxID=54252 RepID=UPI00064E3412|nr:hypothetical protein [Pyrolobus fumarii]
MDSRVNHEAWLEPLGSRLVARWGHYPRIDGRLDPHVVTNIMVVGEEGVRYTPVVLVHMEDGLRLEWRGGRASYAMIAYRRGPFSKTASGEWVYGDRVAVESVLGSVEKSMIIEGYAVYTRDPRSLEHLPTPLRLKLSIDTSPLCVRIEGVRAPDEQPDSHTTLSMWCRGEKTEDRECREAPIFILVKHDSKLGTGRVDTLRTILTVYIDAPPA